jgi:protease-4
LENSLPQPDPQEKNPNIIIRLIEFILRLVRVYFISIGVFVTLIPLLIYYLANQYSYQEDPQLIRTTIGESEKVVLQFDLSGVIAERSPNEAEELINRFFGEKRALTITSIGTALRRAAHDKRVKGILVRLGDLSGSFADYTELRALFKQFKTSKKPLHFHSDNLDTKGYYLASVANRLVMPFPGEVQLIGPAFQLIYFASALSKLGVEYEVVRTGRYKSAFEMMIADEPSAPTVEMYQAMNNHLLDHMVREIAQGRKRTGNEVLEWVRRSLYTGPLAKSSGLVDELLYLPAYKEAFKKKLDGDSYLGYRAYLDGSIELDDPVTNYRGAKIALIEAIGPIVTYSSGSRMGGRQDEIYVERMVKELQWARDDEDIKGVVMRISSPGGVAYAADLIWDEVRLLADKKPVIVSMGSVAASGGYYIAAPATKILADPTTITGSIGVIAATPKLSGFKKKYGVSFHVITESERKGMLNMGSPLSPKDREILQSQADQVYNLFLSRVSAGRGMNVKRVGELAEGRVYTGVEAFRLGLVDQLGGIHEAYFLAKELGGLNPHHLYPIARYRGSEMSFMECVRSGSSMVDCINNLESSISALWSSPSTILSMLDRDTMTPKLKEALRLIGEEKPLAYWNF